MFQLYIFEKQERNTEHGKKKKKKDGTRRLAFPAKEDKNTQCFGLLIDIAGQWTVHCNMDRENSGWNR